MRPGGTQTKHGAAVRMRRRLGLAPRACVLLSCSLVLVIAGVSAYGMTVPSMVQAHAARELHIGRMRPKATLGTTSRIYVGECGLARCVRWRRCGRSPRPRTTRSRWPTARPSCSPTPRSSIEACPTIAWRLTVNKVEQQKEQDAQQTGKPGGSGSSGSSSDSSSSGGGSGSGSASGGGSSEMMARRTAVPAGTRARAVSRLPRKRVSTAGS